MYDYFFILVILVSLLMGYLSGKTEQILGYALGYLSGCLILIYVCMHYIG